MTRVAQGRKRRSLQAAMIFALGLAALAAVAPWALATFPGARGQIAFSAQHRSCISVGAMAEIIALNPDGTGRRFLSDPAANTNPVHIPDSPTNDHDPAWSPDGRRLALAAGGSIAWINANGSGRRWLGGSQTDTDSNPAWGPRGNELAFQRTGPATRTTTGYDSAIYIQRLGEATPRLLVMDALEPSWSPDGTQVAFTRRTSNQSDIWVVNAAGTQTTNLTTSSESEGSPDWSPDGRQIAFSRNVQVPWSVDPSVKVFVSNVWVMSASGGGGTQLTVTPLNDGNAGGLGGAEPAWSPDGTQIAYSVLRHEPANGISIWVMRAGGSARQEIAPCPGGSSPSWQPLYDTDGDGLRDTWERYGADYDLDGVVDLDLPAMGADYRHKDVFVEVDAMAGRDGSSFTHRLSQLAIDYVVDAYKQGLAKNPDGVPGITLHVDNGPLSVMNPKTGAKWGALSEATDAISHQEELGALVDGEFDFTARSQFDGSPSFDDLKASNFEATRRQGFHYALSVHSLAKSAGHSIAAGLARSVGGDDFVVALGGEGPVDNSVDGEGQAGTFMHELGHNLGLDHGGTDGFNYKPNYVSVMNYANGWGIYDSQRGRRFDYSRPDRPGVTLREAKLPELPGFGVSENDKWATLWTIVRELDDTFAQDDPFGIHCNPIPARPREDGAVIRQTPWEFGTARVDWNCDNFSSNVGTVDADIDGDGDKTSVYGPVDDWAALVYAGGAIGGWSAPGLVPEKVPLKEASVDELRANRDLLKQAAGDPAAGDTSAPAPSCQSADEIWHAGNVVFSCIAADDGSGLGNPADASFELSAAVAAGYETDKAMTDSREVCDQEGNCTTVGPIEGIKIDRKAPTVECAEEHDGNWRGFNPTFDCLAYDDGSDLADPDSGSFGLTTSVPLGHETADASTNSREVCDGVGNCTTAGPRTDLKVDLKPPTVDCGEPDDEPHTENITVACTAADAGSGLYDAADSSFTLVTGVPDGVKNDLAYTGTRVVCDAVFAQSGTCAQAGPAGPFRIDRSGGNQPPVAVDDTLAAPNDLLSPFLTTARTVLVLANDSDPENDTLQLVQTPPTFTAHGTVTCTLLGSCSYKPATGYIGPDSFSYTVGDGHGNAATATVHITVTRVNHRPNTAADLLVTDEGVPGQVSVLNNDSDPDGDGLTVSAVFDGTFPGATTCTLAGLCTFSPPAGFTGETFFTYIASDGKGGTRSATVSVTVQPSAQHPPNAADDSIVTDEDTAGTAMVLVNDTDPDGDAITVTGNAEPAHGSASCDLLGLCTYTPAAGYHGSDSFTYTVSDSGGRTSAGTVNVTVRHVNHKPSAAGDVLALDQDTQADVDVLGNDSDPDGDSLAVSESTDGAHGTVSCAPAGSCTYKPAAGFYGSDAFTYTASDGNGGSQTASVDVTVRHVNHTPSPTNDDLTLDQDTSSQVSVLGNDTDPDGDALTVIGSTHGAHGTVACTANGSCTYTPAAGFYGPDSFKYTASDGHGGSAAGSVSVTVRHVNHAPVANAASLATDESVPLEITLKGSDSDGDGLSFLLGSGPSHGSLGSIAADGKVTYTPAAGYYGSDEFKFRVGDGALQSALATVAIDVRRVAHSSATSYTGDGSVQYSDRATFSGRLVDTTAGNAPVAGRQLGFTLGGTSATAGPTDTGGRASSSVQILERPGSVSSIAAAFAGETWLRASSDTGAFAVGKEDCTLTYTGDTLVSALASTTLAADLGEPDTSLGNRSGKTITFTLTDSTGSQTQYTALTNASGRASAITPLVADAYAVSVSFAGDAYYKSCAPDTDTLVTVQAAMAKVTGGGWTSIGTGNTGFGFNAIPQAGGIYKGQLQIRAKNGKDKYHAANVTTFTSSGATATWTGSGKWNGTSGYTYKITVVDGGPSGAKKSDTIDITIKSPTSTVMYTTSGAQALKGGNITVR